MAASQVAETVVNGRAVDDRMGLLCACTYTSYVCMCVHTYACMCVCVCVYGTGLNGQDTG